MKKVSVLKRFIGDESEVEYKDIPLQIFKKLFGDPKKIKVKPPGAIDVKSGKVTVYAESVNEISGVDVAKKVLKNKSYEKGIDLQTANLIVTIDKAYDKNPKLQKKFRAIPLAKMKQLVMKYYG